MIGVRHAVIHRCYHLKMQVKLAKTAVSSELVSLLATKNKEKKWSDLMYGY